MSNGVKKSNINRLIIQNSTYSEVPTGNINGSNKVFTVSNTMIRSSVLVFYNGMLMRDGEDYDYTITDDTEITFNGSPETDSYILVNYVKA